MKDYVLELTRPMDATVKSLLEKIGHIVFYDELIPDALIFETEVTNFSYDFNKSFREA